VVELHRVVVIAVVPEGVFPSEAFFPLADFAAEREKDAQLAYALVVALTLAAFLCAG